MGVADPRAQGELSCFCFPSAGYCSMVCATITAPRHGRPGLVGRLSWRSPFGMQRFPEGRGTQTKDTDDLMKPEFALSLSFDGIALLVRGAGGWQRVGEIPTDTPDMPAALAALRAKATAALPGKSLHCKLILPDAQIRYLTIQTGERSNDARITSARKALEGATPYSVSELAFDISPDGADTHVAAVAIETLEEAESFALAHGFDPVSFVAAPEGHVFLGEPFFGTPRAARGLEIEPDEIAVVEIGPLSLEDSDAASISAAPASELSASSADVAHSADTQTTDAADASVEDDQSGAKADEAETDAQADLFKKPEVDAMGKGEDALAPHSGGPIILPAAPPSAEPTQSSGAEATELDSPPNTPDDLSSPHPDENQDAQDQDAAAALSFSSRRARGEAAPLSAQRRAPTEGPTAAVVLRPETAETASADLRSKAPLTTGPQRDASESSPTASVPPAPSLSMPTPVLAHTTSAPPRPAADTAPAAARPVSPPQNDISQMPQARSLRSRSGRIGLVAVTLATVSALGAWALVQELPELWSDLRRADLVQTEDPVATPVLATAEDSERAAGLVAPGLSASDAPFLPSDDASLPADFDTGQVAAPQADPDGLTVTDAAVLEALGTPVVDEVAPIDGQDLVIASLPAPRDISGTGDESGQAQETSQDDLSNEGADIDPEALADGVVPDDAADAGEGLDGTVADLEAAAQYAATGIWQRVPDIAELPPLIDLDSMYVASIDNTELSQDAIALPARTALNTDTPFGAVSNPTEAGRAFDLDARGLVEATPEGTLNPDGIMVFSGRPEITPPATPDRPSARVQEAADTTARIALLQKLRPRTRPNDLVEQAERAQHGGVVRAELLSKRPPTRPASLKTEEQESQPATALAVARAPQPRARPANFANLVDRAKRRQQQQQTAAVSAPAAVVTPSIPSSASVARQATVQRALNLRRVNLIGVYGKPSARRALVRLPSGRYVKVKVGDRIDGGRIVAIGDSQLQYQKGGRNRTLNLPNS